MTGVVLGEMLIGRRLYVFCRKMGLYMHCWFYISQFFKRSEKFVCELRVLHEPCMLVLKKCCVS
jgi:hypothetical protein